jgi:2-oxoglutarate ferredoxin oxidoreductase subunit alpha
MGKDPCSILIGGEAGQGLVTIGDLLVKALVRSGYRIVVTQDYQSRVRGGHNTFVIRAGTGDLLAAQEPIDLLLALDEATVELHRAQLSPGGIMVVDAAFTGSPDEALKVPYQDLAEGRYSNVAALGVAGALLGLDQGMVAHALDKAFGKKHPEAVSKNSEALSKAYDWCQGQLDSSIRLPQVAEPALRLTMNGNDAIALGAMAAGVKFCAFYPMTPSTSIALNLAGRAEKMGLVVEQAEDEIAAINMAVGAAYAGAPSLVTTSGGGFALMCEGVSLAAMTETPVVVTVVQRPGPATGLPTRTAQADLEMVLFAGHGEFGRAIFAPGSVEECFHLTRRAFETAEIYQGPVFILSDQYLADSYRAVAPFDLPGGPTVDPARPQSVPEGQIYQRYAITPTGVSPRLVPGLTEHLVVADSDEHTEDGHLTEDLDVARRMAEKRMRKVDVLRDLVLPPEKSGDDHPELLLVCWGSSQGPVLEAAALLRASGRRVGVLYFAQVWPLIEEHFMGHLREAGLVVAVEGNATGQLARIIRRETGFAIKELVSRYDGLPLTPEYILRRLDDLGA